MDHLVRLHPGAVVHLPALAAEHGRRLVYAIFVFLAAGTSIGIITAVAYWSHHPLVVPSLGPTAFLIFNRSQSAAARPRTAVLGHLVGALAGYLALVCFGLAHAPSVVAGGLTAPRIGAAVLSIGLTSAVMILTGVEHGPAGATTLIVSLGFMTTPASLGLLMAGVAGLVVCGVIIDRAVGLHLPYWSDRADHRVPRSVLRRLGPFSFDGPPTTNHNGTKVAGHRSPSEADRRWVVAPGEGRELLVGAERCRVKVEGATANGSYAVVEVELDPAQPVTLQHVHYGFAETYIVTEGEVEAEIGTDRIRAGPGSVIAVPPGAVHHIVGRGRRPAHCLCITEQAAQSWPEFLP